MSIGVMFLLAILAFLLFGVKGLLVAVVVLLLLSVVKDQPT